MAKFFLLLSAASCGLAVVLGAFAAHGLKGRLEPALHAAFNTGVEYQFYHGLALLGVAVLHQHWQGSSLLASAGILFLLGVLLFSGSLYGLSLLQWKWLGPVTPLGGICFIAGWSCLFLAALQRDS
jgi:uncharacterized membrane protein YgdD (TMEM256/DUF423 family)